MAGRKSIKPTKTERMYKILEYLKKNTDREHPTSQRQMRDIAEIKEYILHKETFHNLIIEMADALNSDSDGMLLMEKDWKLIFDDFKRLYGEPDEEKEDEEAESQSNMIQIRNLYYQHTFSYNEINHLIEGVWAANTIDTETAKCLIDKIENNLTTKFYKNARKICKVIEPSLADEKTLKNNLLVLQEAIDKQRKVVFQFNGYTHKKKLEPLGKEKTTVSPYYIVAYGGRYYLLGTPEFSEEKNEKRMFIWRVDLMTELAMIEPTCGISREAAAATPKNQVRNLPQEWDDSFIFKHLNMSFDCPVRVTLKIKSEKSVRPDYTFLHDWFGDGFTYRGTEKTPPYDDIVEVMCSPFGMVNWALQYSDRVEVISPPEVRDAVIERIQGLSEKYMNEGRNE